MTQQSMGLSFVNTLTEGVKPPPTQLTPSLRSCVTAHHVILTGNAWYWVGAGYY